MWCPLLRQKEGKKKKQKTLVSDTVQIISVQPSCGLCGGSISFKLWNYSPSSLIKQLVNDSIVIMIHSIISNMVKRECNGLFDWKKKRI